MLAQTAHKVGAGFMPQLRKQTIRVPSGGTVALSWFVAVEEEEEEPELIVIGLPGAGSCFTHHGLVPTLLCHLHQRYARRNGSVSHAEGGPARDRAEEAGGVQGEGFRRRLVCAIATYQGLAGLPLESPKLPGSAYCSTDDMGALLRAARAHYPHAHIVVLAASFGTALFTNWAARFPDEAEALGVRGAILLGFGHSVRDAVAASDAIVQSSAFVIRTWLRCLHQGGGIHTLHALEETCPGFRLSDLLSARTLREWDAAAAPAYGFRSTDELYSASDVQPILGQVRVPLLFVNADDDPLCPTARLRGSTYRRPHFARVATRFGGHLGWLESLSKPSGPASHCPWAARVVEEVIVSIPEWRGASEPERPRAGAHEKDAPCGVQEEVAHHSPTFVRC